MFRTNEKHVCTLPKGSTSFLPPLLPNASIFRKLLRFWRKLILVAEINPRSLQFFRSTFEVIEERKKQIEVGSWIIHPCSTFRLFYEMWMTFIFLFALIYMPLIAAYYSILLPEKTSRVFLCVCCWIDIVITFMTGYKSSNGEVIVMVPKMIIKRYLLSIYFISDLLSSIPTFEDKPHEHAIRHYMSFLGILKIVRFGTFIRYMDRTIFFFKLHTSAYGFIKLIIVMSLTVHYASGFVFILHTLLETSERMRYGKENPFWPTYVKNVYQGAAYLIGTDLYYGPDKSPSVYICTMITYCFGKLLATYAIVKIIDMLKSENALENKYFQMMNQVNAYMISKKIPVHIQKRMQEYYYYKYRQKYFKENTITKFLSDNLKREINYHSCRKLVRNVKIFETLPQKILEDILSYLKIEIFLTGDAIIQGGSFADCMYFLSSGTVAVISPSGKEICHLEDGAYFGEIALLVQDQKRCASVIALEICEVYKLDRRAFKKCMKTNIDLFKTIQQEAKRRYEETKDIEGMFMKEFSAKF